ncbi:hypothetical protein CN946_15880 [Bacillus sp. AFS053548]|nr:hypothetical protein CN946_15880 [Bacillus sp. AFS053548]
MAVKKLNQRTIVYASLNGSTETVSWQVLAGHLPNQLRIDTNFPRKRFETKMSVKSAGPYYQVKALNKTGQVIGISHIVQI